MYTELQVGNEVYKLRLNTRASVALEKSLGYNPIGLLMKIDEGEMPKLNDVLIILQAMLQPYHHGYTLDKVYDLFDRYIEDGKGMFDLIPVIIEVFQNSGYLTVAGQEAETEAKN
jgi:hypothetical protein